MQKALKTLPWVRDVQVSFEEKKATVTVLADQYDPQALIRALKEGDFDGKVVN